MTAGSFLKRGSLRRRSPNLILGIPKVTRMLRPRYHLFLCPHLGCHPLPEGNHSR